MERGDALGVAEAVHLDGVALREPGDADVLVAVGGEDVLLVGGEDERGEERRVPEDEGPAGGVLVRREGVLFRCGGEGRVV